LQKARTGVKRPERFKNRGATATGWWTEDSGALGIGTQVIKCNWAQGRPRNQSLDAISQGLRKFLSSGLKGCPADNLSTKEPPQRGREKTNMGEVSEGEKGRELQKGERL